MNAPKTTRVAVVQTLAALGDVEANIATVQSYVEQAADQRAELVVFPECMNSGYLFDDEAHCRQIAEDIETGPFVTALQHLAADHHIHIVSGITERDPVDGCIYNSAIMLDASGKLIGHYRKQFLATHDYNWFEVGNRGCVVVDTDLGRVGLLICFDGRIPEIARVLALSGAQMIVDVANFFEMDQADQWVPARAYENGVWMIASTKSGVERSIYYPGGSQIVGPDGIVRTSIPRDSHGLAIADIEPVLADDKRWPGGDRFLDRRPECYELLSTPFDQTPAAELTTQSSTPAEGMVKAAVVQAHSLGTSDSLEEAVAMIDDAAKLGVRLLVLPQHFAIGSADPTAADVAAAQDIQRAAHTAIAKICQTYAAVAVVPMTYPSPTGVSEVAVIIGPDGDDLARVSPIHGHTGTPAADGFPVIDSPAGKLGVLIGYDGMFPESSRVLALAGAEIIVWSCAWHSPLQRQLLAVTKAEDNRCYVMAANRTDSRYPGGSLIISPLGLPHWDVSVAAPPVTRHGAVIPAYLNRSLSRQKAMIPRVDMLARRLVGTYDPLTSQGIVGS
ncbi:carbon-nitrogen hydrolase family protein [Mycobacteroides abscessus]|uniref:carbon-nitrogen hydrolase family protein n=1 Tax=Mycobacteroides abscessus TaxID=36809 RepID=UPI0009A8D7A0|nr:carbon-nitrogen hydrolase family protein [Mycobacteroides abscessus]SLF24395.1 Hypothetical carbon-nitrogen hydrolase family protein [Mycobacteroides abscessus subsp. abscessus]